MVAAWEIGREQNDILIYTKDVCQGGKSERENEGITDSPVTTISANKKLDYLLQGKIHNMEL
jgi:hypothetical protein